MALRLLRLMALLVSASCFQTTKVTPEYINPPINLAVVQIAAQTYRLTFFSDNREGGFAGYGIFTADSTTAVATYPAAEQSSAAFFCAITGQPDYRTVMSIEIGPTAGNGSLCNATTLLLNPGQYVALRGRVERSERPWSEAAIVRVP